jgi:hypothetical protein
MRDFNASKSRIRLRKEPTIFNSSVRRRLSTRNAAEYVAKTVIIPERKALEKSQLGTRLKPKLTLKAAIPSTT